MLVYVEIVRKGLQNKIDAGKTSRTESDSVQC